MKADPYVVKKDIHGTGLWRHSPTALGRLDLELTERCNNHCVHCYINRPAGDLAAKKKELTTGEIKNILQEAASLGCLTVRFTGGEPLLREDFEALYVFARRQGLKVLIYTNATLITPRLAGLFARIPPREKIEITVYGMKKSSYEAATRAKGSYGAFKRGIKLLLKHKVPFVVKGVLLPANKSELADFEKWAATVSDMGRMPSSSMFFDLRARREKSKNKIIKKLRIPPSEGIAILARHEARYTQSMLEFCSRFMRPSGKVLFSCGAGCGGCVDAYGSFQPCMMLRHPDTVYNLRQGSLKEALTEFFPKLRKLKARHPDYLKRCARCFLKGLCEQCPAKSWMEHGTLDTPVEYFCEIAHVQARFLGFLKENENGWEVRDWKRRIHGIKDRDRSKKG